MNFLDLAKQRCSIRSFSSQPIEYEKIQYILEAARVAPTACNKQPQRIMVIQKPYNLRKVEKVYKTFGAPCVLIVCQDTRNALVRPFDNRCSGDLDIGIVTDHMMLAARSIGVGSVMIGLFNPTIIQKDLDIPSYFDITALLILGYPQKGFLDENRHETKRLPLNKLLLNEPITD